MVDVRLFINGCITYQRAKDTTPTQPGQLASLPIPMEHFTYWSLVFVSCLSLNHNFNVVIVCIDKLTKLICLAPCATGERGLFTQETAKLFNDTVACKYGVPKQVIYDCDRHFTSPFWKVFSKQQAVNFYIVWHFILKQMGK